MPPIVLCLLQCEAVTFGHCHCHPCYLHIFDCIDEGCDQTTCATTTLERVVLAQHVLNWTTIGSNNETASMDRLLRHSLGKSGSYYRLLHRQRPSFLYRGLHTILSLTILSVYRRRNASCCSTYAQ